MGRREEKRMGEKGEAPRTGVGAKFLKVFFFFLEIVS